MKEDSRRQRPPAPPSCVSPGTQSPQPDRGRLARSPCRVPPLPPLAAATHLHRSPPRPREHAAPRAAEPATGASSHRAAAAPPERAGAGPRACAARAGPRQVTAVPAAGCGSAAGCTRGGAALRPLPAPAGVTERGGDRSPAQGAAAAGGRGVAPWRLRWVSVETSSHGYLSVPGALTDIPATIPMRARQR